MEFKCSWWYQCKCINQKYHIKNLQIIIIVLVFEIHFVMCIYFHYQGLGALSRNDQTNLQQVPDKNTLDGADGTTRLADNSTIMPFRFDLFNTQVRIYLLLYFYDMLICREELT